MRSRTTTCTSARRIARGHTTDPLGLVAQLVDGSTHGGGAEASAAIAAATDATPCFVFGAQFEPDGIDLFVQSIEGHPADELLGFVAPSDWSCIGVSSGAWASTYDGPAGRPATTGVDRRRVHLVFAVDRSGASVSIFRDGAAPPSTRRQAHATSETAGAIDDCLRRTLDLPTAAPGSTLEYFAVRWIDDIFSRSVDGGLDGASWADLAMRHDALRAAAAGGDPRLLGWGIEHLARAGEIQAEAQPWSAVRAAAIDQHEASGRPDAADALAHLRWMDDGIFSRSVLGRYPPLEDLLLDLYGLLPPDLYVRVVDTIEAWQLLR